MRTQRFIDFLRSGRYGIVSAPDIYELKRSVIGNLVLPYKQLTGYWKGDSEQSLLVYGINLESIKKLGKKFNQTHILLANRGSALLCDLRPETGYVINRLDNLVVEESNSGVFTDALGENYSVAEFKTDDGIQFVGFKFK